MTKRAHASGRIKPLTWKRMTGLESNHHFELRAINEKQGFYITKTEGGYHLEHLLIVNGVEHVGSPVIPFHKIVRQAKECASRVAAGLPQTR